MKDRILKIRKAAGLTQTEFGAELGATRPMIASYEGGKVVPDKSMQMLICSKFNINYDWLSDGIGEMTASRPLIPELVRILRQYPALEAAMIKMIDIMGPEDWEALNRVVQRAIDSKQ